MKVRDDRREAATERMADYVLAEGLGAATLRPLAAAAGTSDRMLLYYFSNKHELLAAVMENLASRFLRELDDAIPISAPRPFALLLEEVWAVLRSPQHRQHMDFWMDIAAGAARALEPHRSVAGKIADGYLAWVAARLAPEGGSSPFRAASLFVAAVEGMYLLDAIGRPIQAADAMIALSARLTYQATA